MNIKFTRYLNNRLQTLVVEAAKGDQSTLRGAETDALQFVFSAYRFVFAGLFIPFVFIKYLLVRTGFQSAPAPELDIMKHEHELEQNARHNKLARKVGMQGRA